MKSILAMVMVMVMVIPVIFGAGFAEKPCDSITQYEYKGKCVSVSCFSTYIPRLYMQGSSGNILEGNVQFFNGNLLVEVFFLDIQTDGLTNRDNSKSCLDTKFVRYSSQVDKVGTDHTGTVISTFEIESQYRKYIFVIDQSEFDTLLIKDLSDPKTITYNGYFGLLFLIVDEVQATCYFNFSVEQDTEKSNSVYTSFNSISLVLNREKQIQRVNSILAFCATPGNCTTTSSRKALYENLRFSLLQTITEPGFEDYYLIPVSVTYFGTDLYREQQILSQIRTLGSAEIELLIDFSYNGPLTIQVKSVVSATRILISEIIAIQTISTNFKELDPKFICNHNGSHCITRADSTLAFCATPGNCINTTTQQYLHFDQRFSLLQTITEPGFEDFYLIPVSVEYTTVGYYNKKQINSTARVPGSTEIQLQGEFFYSRPIIIQVTSVLSAVNSNSSVISGTFAYQEIQTSFKGLVEKVVTCNRSGTCIQRADSSLVFCSAPGNCSTTKFTKTLYTNKPFSLLQTISEQGFENFCLIPSSVTFSGEGLDRKAYIVSSTIVPGSTEIQTSIEFEWRGPIIITVESHLSTTTFYKELEASAIKIINATVGKSYETMVGFMVSGVILILF